ncbi:MAG TPA: archaellin/type IV pilin N-terminal domain-containing protein [Sulfolobales archaeon]|nr:archaellin/type IV pilin N-terminal domain-containing protein [Sulfolobales archaeon]
MIVNTSSIRIKRALEPLIAAIILIAITIVIAIAVAAWVLGVFGTSVGGSEQLVVYPDANLYKDNSGTWYINFTVYNKGSVKANVTGVTVGNCSSTSLTPSDGAVDVGQAVTFKASLSSCSFTTGVTYQVKVYTKAGNVYFTTVVAGS